MVKSPSNGSRESSGAISYAENSSGNLPHRVSPSVSGRKKVKFGVKSYLHHFYEDCAGIGRLDDDEEEEEEEEDFHLKPKSSRRCKLLCRIGFTVSVLFICIGVVLLLLGFLIQPRHTKSISGQVVFTNQDNMNFNNFLMYARWVGAFTFCFGGVLLSVCIVLLGLGKLNHKSDLVERKIFEDRLQRGSTTESTQNYKGTDEFGNLVEYGTCGSTTITTPSLTTSHPVPMSLREVTLVQPTMDPR